MENHNCLTDLPAPLFKCHLSCETRLGLYIARYRYNANAEKIAALSCNRIRLYDYYRIVFAFHFFFFYFWALFCTLFTNCFFFLFLYHGEHFKTATDGSKISLDYIWFVCISRQQRCASGVSVCVILVFRSYQNSMVNWIFDRCQLLGRLWASN